MPGPHRHAPVSPLSRALFRALPRGASRGLPRRLPGVLLAGLLAGTAAAALTGCSSGSAAPAGSTAGSPSAAAGSAGATATGSPGGTPSAPGAATGATTSGTGSAPAVSVPADRSGIVTGPSVGPGGSPVVVADAGTVIRAVRAVQRAAGDPQALLLGVLGVGFTGGEGLLRVTVRDPADPAAGLEYTVDVAGAVVGPRRVPETQLLKGFPAPATPERVASLGFTLDQAPLARLDAALAAAVRAGKLPGGTVTTWNLTRERTDTSTDATRLEWLVAVQAGPKDATVTLGADTAVIEVDAG